MAVQAKDPAASEPARPEDAAPAAFDVEAMALLLDGAHHELRARIRSILARPSFAIPEEISRQEYRELVYRWLRKLAAEGLGRVGYPSSVGGEGDVEGGVAVFETLAFHDLSLLVKFGVQFGLFGGTIAQLGTEEHHRELLPKVGSVELPGCFAMTERGHGSNVRDLETVATWDPAAAEFDVHTANDDAGKDFIGNAGVHGRMAVVFAQLSVAGEEHGVHALLVPLRDGRGKALLGVRLEDCGPKAGLNGVDNGRIWFSHVRVPRTALLNRFADVSEDGGYSSPIKDPGRRFFTMLGALVQGRVSIAAASVSASKTALATAVRYGSVRRQFGPGGGAAETPILDYVTHQRRLMPLLATTYALDFAVKHLVREYARSLGGGAGLGERAGARRRRQVETLAAGLKAFASWHAVETVQTCREACGGRGYMASSGLGRLRDDVDVFTTFEGDNTVLLQLVAKGLLTDYRMEFADMDLLRMARLMAGRWLGGLAEALPAPGDMFPALVTAVTGRDGGDDAAVLLSRDWQLGAFRYQERHMREGLARRMRKLMGEGVSGFEAAMRVQDHMVSTALAHVELVVLGQFDAAARRVRRKDLREVLGTLCDLYALGRVERDRGWFQEHGHLSTGRSKSVVKTVTELCGSVRGMAEGLVAAFGVPEPLPTASAG